MFDTPKLGVKVEGHSSWVLPLASESQRMSLTLALYRYFTVYYKRMTQRRAAAGSKQVAVEVRLSCNLVFTTG